jgi:hypothetical protein
VGWEEFGHVPPAVQATLDVGWNGINKNMDNYSSVVEDSEMHRALYLLYVANGHDDDYNTQQIDIPMVIDVSIPTSVSIHTTASLLSSPPPLTSSDYGGYCNVWQLSMDDG